jgi:two-component system CheB/CheR fusion protein
VPDVQAVLDTLVPREAEVQTTSGAWFLMRIQPYRTLENVIEGAVISFVDITAMKRMRAALQSANEQLRLAVVVRDAHDAITVHDLEGRTLAWNPGAVRMYGWTEAEALRLNVRDRIPAGLQVDAVARLQQLSRSEVLEPDRTQRLTKAGAVLNVSVISTALLTEAGKIYAIATTERARDAEMGA